MAVLRSVVLNGDLGSGKTTVSISLAKRLGVRRVSVGDLYRSMAAERGMTALQLNLHAELDDEVDHYVDQLQRDVAASGEQVVVDSRLAWRFFTDALKVHMVTDPVVAAQRVLDRSGSSVERYASIEEARIRIAARSESERARFISRYGLDKSRLRNYDLICDSTSAGPDEIVERIVEHLEPPSREAPRPLCYIDPRRIYRAADQPEPEEASYGGRVAVGYTAPNFFAVHGHERLIAAIAAGDTLVAATLVGEAEEQINGQHCDAYFRAECAAGATTGTVDHADLR